MPGVRLLDHLPDNNYFTNVKKRIRRPLTGQKPRLSLRM